MHAHANTAKAIPRITQWQRVVVNGQYSEWLPVASGVPQGSILGPLLFILYVTGLKQFQITHEIQCISACI